MSQTKVFGWNVRGLNKPKRQRIVREWIISTGAPLGALIETHVREDRAHHISQRIMPGWRLESNYNTGVIGRIWLIYDPNQVLVLVYSRDSQKLICGVTNLITREQFTLVVIYASNDLDPRAQLWNELSEFSRDVRLSNQPWAVIGDFNQIATPSDYFSERGDSPSLQGTRAFQNLLSDANLFDLPFSGVHYTWLNRQPTNPVAKKLDRVLVTDSWLLNFPLSYAIFEASGVSDHARFVMNLGANNHKTRTSFKYFSFLSKHEDFIPLIRDHWDSFEVNGSDMYRFVQKRKGIKSLLADLNRKHYQNIHLKTKEAKDRLMELQSALLRAPSSGLFEQESLAHKSWYALSEIEEKFYKQKSRLKWLKEGDFNSKFFHRTVISRQAINRIRCLIDEGGNRITDMVQLKQLILDYYVGLLGTAHVEVSVLSVNQLQLLLPFRCSQDLKSALVQLPSPTEIKDIISGMPKNRSPGPDGFPIDFYLHSWQVTGLDLTHAVLEFFTSGIILREINATSITLIPKIKGADKLKDFRPISCCNATYKIISTIIARKLRSFLEHAVQRNQVGFVKGRMLSENVLLASELIADFHKSGPTRRGCLKVDLAKAYDNVCWEFIINILKAIDTPSQLIHWIKVCISTPSYSVNLNGELIGFFPGKKGLRQGDPLSSSLFVLAMDVLSKMLDKGAQEGRFSLHSSCKRPLITHLSFADDLLIFFDGSSTSLQGILEILNNFSSTSGLKMNNEKTVLFLDGHNQELLSDMANEYGITSGYLPVKYLGLPLSPRGIKLQDYQILIDKTRQRIESWTVKHLSFAGRLQLVRSVLNSLINFWISVFLLPSKCLLRLEALCRAFLWKGTSTSAKGAKVAWVSICKPKEQGGLGLKRLTKWSTVFGLKQIWMLFANGGSLWVAWAKSHLIKNGCLWSSQFTNKGSQQWRSLLRLRPLAAQFIKCQLLSGSMASFWYDSWLPQGTLIQAVGELGPAISGIGSLASVRQTILDGQWVISSSSRNPIISRIRLLLPSTPPTLENSEVDLYLWKVSSTHYSLKFSSAATWMLINPPIANVAWYKVIWISPRIPKHSFLLWTVAWRRLPTKDRMLRWGLDISPECVLCRSTSETLDHLIVGCPFIQDIWIHFGFILRRDQWTSLDVMLNWFINRKEKKVRKQIERLLMQAIVYEIWMERNGRIHNRPHSTRESIIWRIQSIIRSKLSAGPYSSPSTQASIPLLQLWFQEFQLSPSTPQVPLLAIMSPRSPLR